ncbi:MAG: hypothetical protein AB8E82_12290 [Aureispira sp.]
MEKYTTQSMEIVVRPDGILEVSIPADWDQPDTVETTTENALLLQKINTGKRHAALVLMPDFYMKKEIIEIYNRMGTGEVADALLVNSFSAKVLGNLVLKILKRNHPIRLFTDRNKAEEWLLRIISGQEA